MKPYRVAFVVYGDSNSPRDALLEEKYMGLAIAFLSAGFSVHSILYHDKMKEDVYTKLIKFDAVLVWVNPIEQGNDRRQLNALLTSIADKGVLVSAHPEVILKIGTKEVLFTTKDMDWSSKTNLYSSYQDFVAQFPGSLMQSGIKIIKQYRGNGGNGVFKITKGPAEDEVTVLPAQRGESARILTWSELFNECHPYFRDGGKLIEQQWNTQLGNGMVRCYLCGNKVAGFGYQEINALYEQSTTEGIQQLPPSSRYYFSENCGLFSDLKAMMETTWVPQLQQIHSLPSNWLPVIWDADFFINQPNSHTAVGKYTLCEINVSSVSPFPPSAIPFIVKEVGDRIQKIKESRRTDN